MRCTSDGPSPMRLMRSSRYQRSSGSSFETPSPPKIWMQRSTTRPAVSVAVTLAIEASSFRSWPRSAFQAACQVSSRAARSSISLSASIHWIACFSDSREPNVSRCFAQSIASSSAACAMPSVPAA